MNKVVVMLFVMIVGAVLIGVPLWGFFHPKVMPGYEELHEQQVDASSVSGDLVGRFVNTNWTVSHNINLDVGYGQVLPVVVDVELHFMPSEKMMCKANIYSDGALPPDFEALKTRLEAGWEGRWHPEGTEYIRIDSEDVFKGIKDLSAISPFNLKNYKIEADSLKYSANGNDFFSFKRF